MMWRSTGVVGSAVLLLGASPPLVRGNPLPGVPRGFPHDLARNRRARPCSPAGAMEVWRRPLVLRRQIEEGCAWGAVAAASRAGGDETR